MNFRIVVYELAFHYLIKRLDKTLSRSRRNRTFSLD